MTIQPVRLSLWHLWDLEAEAEEIGSTDAGLGLSNSDSLRDGLHHQFDLFVDWPIPEAGFVSGHGLGTTRSDSVIVRSGPVAGAVMDPSWADPLSGPAPASSSDSLGSDSIGSDSIGSDSIGSDALGPDALDWSLGWGLPGVGEVVQGVQTLQKNIQSRSIEGLQQWPSRVQSLQNQSQDAFSVYGPKVQDWVGHLRTHPWSKPALLLALPWGTAAVAFQALAGVPGQGACSFNPLPLSDLDQLHCARERMRSQDPRTVIQGFRQLRGWSKDQLLYPVAERQLQSWAAVLLGLARYQFDQGNWRDAEALLAEIPESSSLHRDAQVQRTAWLGVRRQGEDLLGQAKQAIASQRWQAARRYAQRLSGLSNDYWRRQGLETLPGQIDRRARLPQSPATPLALGSMPWIPVRAANPEFSLEISS
jgi:hypothetical protein